MLKVLVVEDEPYVCRGIVLSVDWTALDCFVVGEAANGEEGYDAALKFQPNIIIPTYACLRWTASRCSSGLGRPAASPR